MPTVTFTLASLPSSTAKRLRFQPRDAPWVNTAGAIVTPDGFESSYPRGAAQSITLDTGPWRVRITTQWFDFDVPAAGGDLKDLILFGVPSNAPQATITAAVNAYLASHPVTVASSTTALGYEPEALGANTSLWLPGADLWVDATESAYELELSFGLVLFGAGDPGLVCQFQIFIIDAATNRQLAYAIFASPPIASSGFISTVVPPLKADVLKGSGKARYVGVVSTQNDVNPSGTPITFNPTWVPANSSHYQLTARRR